jgi:hypothetical protein
MSEKQPWHQPKFQILDARATASDPSGTPDDPIHTLDNIIVTSDDSTQDNATFVHATGHDSSASPDPGGKGFFDALGS